MTTPRITRIIYREYPDDLFDGQDTVGIDLNASADEFLAQLKLHLQNEYPGVVSMFAADDYERGEWYVEKSV